MVNLERRRYYRASLTIDLLGDVTLERSWGSLDYAENRGNRCIYENWEDGLRQLNMTKQRRLRDGYHFVKSQSEGDFQDQNT